MFTRINLSLINKLILLLCVFVFSASSSFAVTNTLSGITVNQYNNKYMITLKLDKTENVKKIPQSDNRLMLVINSTVPMDSPDIVYDNAKDIENVIVQRKNTDNTIIYIEGKNVKTSDVFVKDLSTGLLKESNNNNFLYVTDFKILLLLIASFIFIFSVMLLNRPKSKQYTINKQIVKKKTSEINTLRKKNSIQNRYIPSINYNIKNSLMSVPSDLSAVNYYQEEEEIRKAG